VCNEWVGFLRGIRSYKVTTTQRAPQPREKHKFNIKKSQNPNFHSVHIPTQTYHVQYHWTFRPDTTALSSTGNDRVIFVAGE